MQPAAIFGKQFNISRGVVCLLYAALEYIASLRK